ncbi:MAG: AIR synthase-related protein, partial [bacterium]|nr:AIR synthase-related protein [bacterium]
VAGQLGIEADISKVRGTTKHPHAVLFSESQGRILVTVRPDAAAKFEKFFKGQAIRRIGAVTKGKTLSIRSGKKKIASLSLAKALSAYRSRFKGW